MSTPSKPASSLKPLSLIDPSIKSPKEKKREILRSIKRHPGRTKKYWIDIHEDAIRDYVNSKDKEERSKLYETVIYGGVKEMIENIVNTFSFGYLPNIGEKKMDCLIKVTESLDRYDPSRGFKAFGYFSIVIKNWFLIEINKFKKAQKEYVSLDGALANLLDASGVDSHHFISDNILENQMIYEEHIENFLDDFAVWNEEFRLNTNLYKVYNCIQELFCGDGLDEIETIDRKNIYEYIFSKTGLSNNQIANALYRLRRQYKAFGLQ